MKKSPKDKPSAAEFGQLRAFLASKLKVKQAQINAAIGNNANARTREEVVKKLIDWMRTL